MSALINRIANNWSNLGVIDKSDVDIYVYGLELLLYSILNLIAILTTAVLYGYMFESIILIIILVPFQAFGGGYHAKTHLRCFLIMYIGWWIVVHIIPMISIFVATIICVSSVIVVFLLAPIPNENVPMSENQRHKMRRIVRIIALCALCASVFFIWVVESLAIIGITSAAGLGIAALSMLVAHLTNTHKCKKSR
ncbi:MAG: accessory gene regulator B family protein [Oscillospiraceae bacterium]|nr:accessory gene regulator B family protein [Oscillospiraceae bacterium]